MAIRYGKTDDRKPLTDFRLTSISEVAQQLSIRERQVARLVASGALSSVKLGRRRLIPRQAIVALLADAAV